MKTKLAERNNEKISSKAEKQRDEERISS